MFFCLPLGMLPRQFRLSPPPRTIQALIPQNMVAHGYPGARERVCHWEFVKIVYKSKINVVNKKKTLQARVLCSTGFTAVPAD